jgi:hypothetical protein
MPDRPMKTLNNVLKIMTTNSQKENTVKTEKEIINIVARQRKYYK